MDGSAALLEAQVDVDFVDRFCRGLVSEDDTRKLVAGDLEVTIFTLLAIQQRLGTSTQATGPNTPSGAVPPYQKPAAKPKRGGRKRGGQKGHVGRRRSKPPEPDEVAEHHPGDCPDCDVSVRETGEVRERTTEDIPEDLKPVVTCHRMFRGVCPKCGKRIEGRPVDVLPHCQLGNRTLVLSAMLHFLQGLTISQITDTFNFHLRMKLTGGGLVQMWHRLAEVLWAWYEQIHNECLDGAKLHADETGWRVQGRTHWLWCFAGPSGVYYMIDRSRGSPALKKFFTRYFDGTLITDFWSPYDAVACTDQQKCWPHLLRDVAAVDERNPDDPSWKSFARRLTSAFRAAKKLHSQRPGMPEEDYDMAVARLEGRLANIASDDWKHADARRLAKRLAKYGNQLLTFLWYDDVPGDNNSGERAIRPAVMIRKMSQSNKSDRGAVTQSVLMSVFRTLKLRGHDPIRTILYALAQHIRTGQLPPIPPKSAPNN